MMLYYIDLFAILSLSDFNLDIKQSISWKFKIFQLFLVVSKIKFQLINNRRAQCPLVTVSAGLGVKRRVGCES